MRCQVAAVLDEVDDDDEDDDRRQHDVGTETLVAVADGDVPEAAATDGTGHGRCADEVDDEDRNVVDDRRQSFRQEDLADDLEGRGAHGFSSFEEAVIDVADRRFDEAAEEGNGDDGQGDAGRCRTDRCAGNESGQGDDGHHEDDEGHGTDDVDDGAQNPVDEEVLKDVALAGRNQSDAQGNADDAGNDRGHGDHIERFFNALEH